MIEQPVAREKPARRAWRIRCDEFGCWMMERVILDHAGNEVRDLSATYRNRTQAEQAIIRAMRQESLWRPNLPRP